MTQQQDPNSASTGSNRHHGLAIDLKGCQVLVWSCRCAAMGCLGLSCHFAAFFPDCC